MSQCRSCHAEVVWVRTEGKGALMPLNVAPDPEKGTFIKLEVKDNGVKVVRFISKPERTPDKRLFCSHYVTCPNADWHRKKKE